MAEQRSEPSINKVTLLGRLGKDAETTFTPSGTAITKFSVATSHDYQDSNKEWKSQTTWTNIVLWRKENLGQYLTKGTRVHVDGRIETRSYEDKTGTKKYVTEVIADKVILLGGKSEGGERSSAVGASSRGKASKRDDEGDPFEGQGISDQDVPFNWVRAATGVSIQAAA